MQRAERSAVDLCSEESRLRCFGRWLTHCAVLLLVRQVMEPQAHASRTQPQCACNITGSVTHSGGRSG